MKLYATVTSERASKGQGGNTKLEIKLHGVVQSHLATVYLFPDKIHPEEYMLHICDPKGALMYAQLLQAEKGEKQKGEEQKSKKHPSGCDCYHCF